MHKIGEKVWFKGFEHEVTSEPVIIYGGEYQHTRRLADGNPGVIPTPESVAKNVADKKAAWRAQQEQFRRLHD